MNNRQDDFAPFTVEELNALIQEYKDQKHFYSIYSKHFKALEKFSKQLSVTQGPLAAPDMYGLLNLLKEFQKRVQKLQTATWSSYYGEVDDLEAYKNFQTSKTYHLYSKIKDRVKWLQEIHAPHLPYYQENINFLYAHPQEANKIFSALHVIYFFSDKFKDLVPTIKAYLYDRPAYSENIVRLYKLTTDYRGQSPEVPINLALRLMLNHSEQFQSIANDILLVAVALINSKNTSTLKEIYDYKNDADIINIFHTVAEAIRALPIIDNAFSHFIFKLMAAQPHSAMKLAIECQPIYEHKLFADYSANDFAKMSNLLFNRCQGNLTNVISVLIIMKENYLEQTPFRNLLLQKGNQISQATIELLQKIADASLLLPNNFEKVILQAAYSEEALTLWGIAPDHSQKSFDWVMEQAVLNVDKFKVGLMESEGKSSLLMHSMFDGGMLDTACQVGGTFRKGL